MKRLKSSHFLRCLLGALCMVLGIEMAVPTRVLAQTPPQPSLDVQRFHPVGSYRNFISVHDGELLPVRKFGVDGFLQFGYRPLQQVSTDYKRSDGGLDGLIALHGRVGYAITPWVEVDLSMALMQIGIAGGGIEPLGGDPEQVFSFGDIWLEGRFKALRQDKHLVSFVAIPFVTFPTGNPSLFLTSGVPTVGVKVAVSRRWTRFRLAGHFGYRLLPGSAQVGENIAAEDQLLYGLAFGVSVLPGRLDFGVEWSGSGIVGPAVDELPPQEGIRALHSPTELLITSRIRLRNNVELVAGAGPGLSPGVGTPAFRVFGGLSWAPSLDRDGDTVSDKDDLCPERLEDFDRFVDEDGCPDTDNDEDEVPDREDRCPMFAEDWDGFEDHDGCPDPDNDGDDLVDGEDLCPLDPEDRDGFEDGDGCSDPDNDFDGVRDLVDGCPLSPEDHDGFADGDGCPDLDNDADGVADEMDFCPMRAEDRPGEEGAEGCPEGVSVVAFGDRVHLLAGLAFAPGQDVIYRRSFSTLDALAELLVAHTALALVGIEGPADSGEDGLVAQVQSEARARAVLRELMARGVAPERLRIDAHSEAREDPVLRVHQRIESPAEAALRLQKAELEALAEQRAVLVEERAKARAEAEEKAKAEAEAKVETDEQGAEKGAAAPKSPASGDAEPSAPKRAPKE